ncbi:MAG: hypothetical protein KHX05_08110 [Firmicutes bacterium]|nr:hypothetical protein [Bacillota bacterium]
MDGVIVYDQYFHMYVSSLSAFWLGKIRVLPVALLPTGFLFGTSLLGRKMCRFPTLKCLGGIFGALLKLDHVEIIQLLFPAEYISVQFFHYLLAIAAKLDLLAFFHRKEHLQKPFLCAAAAANHKKRSFTN